MAAKIQLLPEAARFLTTAFPALAVVAGTNFPVMGLGFDTTTQEAAFWVFKASDYTSGNLTVDIEWYAAATSGTVQFGAQIACQTPSDAQSVLTKSLATATTSGTVTKSGTANGPMRNAITVSNLDSIAANDLVWLRLYRDVAADSMAGDAIVTLVEVSYA